MAQPAGGVVEQQDRAAGALALRFEETRDRLQRIGQRCVLGDHAEHLILRRQQGLRPAAFGDVARVEDDRRRLGVAEAVADRLDDAPRPVEAAEAAADRRDHARRCERARQRVAQHRLVVVVYEGEERLAENDVGRSAEDALERRALVTHHAIGVDDGDEIRRVLDEGAEVRLAVLERRGGAVALPLALLDAPPVAV
jgi:hypothetical protein